MIPLALALALALEGGKNAFQVLWEKVENSPYTLSYPRTVDHLQAVPLSPRNGDPR